MNIITFNDLNSMMRHWNFSNPGDILQTNLKECHNDTEVNERPYRDAEVLTTIAKNTIGDCLEIGTSNGEGTYKIATNTKSTIYTLNALPYQMTGHLVTHALDESQIGSFLKEHNIKNYVQIYDNSITWTPPSNIHDLAIVFIDGCHDTEYVYKDSCKTINLLKKGGFMVWHDFNPRLRSKFFWINSAMAGVEKFCEEHGVKEIYHLKDSWMGFCRK